jgi:hypothetical protein
MTSFAVAGLESCCKDDRDRAMIFAGARYEGCAASLALCGAIETFVRLSA